MNPKRLAPQRVILGIAVIAASSGLAVAPIAAEPGAHSRAAIAALLLARIDVAAGQARHGRNFASEVQMLDRLGVHPLDNADDPQSAWRAAAHVSPQPAFRGRVLGLAFQRGWINAGETTHTDQQFLAGQKASLAVAGVPATALMLAVTDAAQVDVCHASGADCTWYPEFTQRYTISIRNMGPRRTRFYLVAD